MVGLGVELKVRGGAVVVVGLGVQLYKGNKHNQRMGNSIACP